MVQCCMTKVELILLQALGEDSALAVYIHQYQIAAHLWLALYSHRQSQADHIRKMVMHVTQAASVLKGVLDPPNVRRQSAATGAHRRSLSSSVRRKVSVSPKVVKTKTAQGAKMTVVKTASPKATRTRAKAQPSVPPAPRKPTSRSVAAASRARPIKNAKATSSGKGRSAVSSMPIVNVAEAPVTPQASKIGRLATLFG